MSNRPIVPQTELMREPLITATLLSIYLSSRGGAKTIGAIQRLYR